MAARQPRHVGKSREGRKIELARGLLVAGKKAAALVMVVIDDCAWDLADGGMEKDGEWLRLCWSRKMDG